MIYLSYLWSQVQVELSCLTYMSLFNNRVSSTYLTFMTTGYRHATYESCTSVFQIPLCQQDQVCRCFLFENVLVALYYWQPCRGGWEYPIIISLKEEVIATRMRMSEFIHWYWSQIHDTREPIMSLKFRSVNYSYQQTLTIMFIVNIGMPVMMIVSGDTYAQHGSRCCFQSHLNCKMEVGILICRLDHKNVYHTLMIPIPKQQNNPTLTTPLPVR